MDEIYLSPDIEEQIVQQLRAMARSKKLHMLRSTFSFLTKALPITLALAAIAALTLGAYSQNSNLTQANQSGNSKPSVQVTKSADGLTQVTTTTQTAPKSTDSTARDSSLLHKLHLR